MLRKRTYLTRIRVGFFKILLLVFTSSKAVEPSDIIRGLMIPEYGVMGEQVTVTCTYDLRNKQLYSLKWYHNKTEFYRFVPTDRKGAVHFRPNTNFQIQEVSRGDQSTTLSLTKLSITATGDFRCEIIAEHPSFRTEALSSYMTILKEPLLPPIIAWKQQTFSPEDTIRIPCQVRSQSISDPRPDIQWFLDGSKVPPDYTSPYGQKHPDGGYLGLALIIAAKKVYEAGGNQIAECRLTLGNFVESEKRSIVVEREVVSYSNTFFFSKGAITASSKSTYLLHMIIMNAIINLISN